MGIFEIAAAQEGDDLFLRIAGELDMSSTDRLEEAIGLAEEGSARRVVVDLTDVEFIDSTALHALLKAFTRSRENGQRLSFVPSRHEAVRQLVAVTGTGEMFD